MMNIFYRILLAVYAVCLTVISIIAMVVALWPGSFIPISEYVRDSILVSSFSSFVLFIISFIIFVLSLVFLFSGFKSDKDKKAVSKHTNIGEIKISLDTIENIALAASRKLNGVRETKASVVKLDDCVDIGIRAIVMPDVNIPVLSEDIQVRVKKSVEDSSGITVNSVKVLVDNVYTGYRSRVE